MAKDVSTRQLGALLRGHRIAAGLSQEELAERAGLSRRAISDLERGARRAPYPATLRRLTKALNLSTTARAELLASARSLEAVSAPAISGVQQQPEHNLPAQATPLIGRQPQLEAARTRLLRADTRLVTLTGAGGCGKTRLGLQIALDVISQFPDGVFLVSLAPVSDPNLVAAAIAQVLGLRESGGGASIRQVVSGYLRERRMLLLIDNFEQVIAAASDIGELLALCPHIKVLVTSRAPLQIYGEWEVAVPPLATPEPRAELPPDEVAQYDAVRLFVERARAVDAHFALTRENTPAIVEICHHLDGLPLAVELAAARLRVLSPQEILERLTDRFALLVDGPRDRPARHQTLRNAIAWSYELLNEHQREQFRSLSVFRGGWALEAAEAVCGPDADVLNGLGWLVKWNLVRHTPVQGRRSRYTMLETILEYARGQLAANDEEHAVRAQHAAFFLDLAEQAEPELRGRNQSAWLDRLEVEIDNLRTALEWLTSRGDAEGALRLCAALAWFWGIRGYWTEGRIWLQRALQGTGGGPLDRTRVRMRALQGAGWLAHVQNDGNTARGLLEECLSIARQIEDQRAVAWTLHLLGRVTYFEGDFGGATALAQDAFELARALEDEWVIGWCLHLLARAAHMRGDYATARMLYTESLSVRQQYGDRDGSAMVFLLMGMLSFHDQKYVEAREFFARGLLMAHELHYGWVEANALATYASVAAATGQSERAARLGAAAERWASVLAVTLVPDYRIELDRALGRARADLGEVAYATAWSIGSMMSTDQAVAYALDSSEVQDKSMHGPLSSREQEVALLVARGMTNRQLADVLVISTRTADHHVAHILAKLGLATRAQIAGWVERMGMAQ